jgi:hypothetical protein
MPKRADRKPQDVACTEKLTQLRLLRLDRSSVLGSRRPAIAMRDGLSFQIGRARFADRRVIAADIGDKERKCVPSRKSEVRSHVEIFNFCRSDRKFFHH